MDKFKAYLQENKAAIDGELPDDSAWENIAGRIGHTQQQNKTLWVKLGSIAAAAAIFAAAWLVYDHPLLPHSEKGLPPGSVEGVTVRNTPAGSADSGPDMPYKNGPIIAGTTDGTTTSAKSNGPATAADGKETSGKDGQHDKGTNGNRDKASIKTPLPGKDNQAIASSNSSKATEKARSNPLQQDTKAAKKQALQEDDCTLLADLDKIDKKILAAFGSPLLKENASCSTALKSQFAQITAREKQIRLYVDCKTENNLDHLLIIQQQKLFLLRQTEEQIRKMAIYSDQPANIINTI